MKKKTNDKFNEKLLKKMRNYIYIYKYIIHDKLTNKKLKK